MRYPDRATVCISSQAGCGMACPFCATGQQGPDPQPVGRRDHRPGGGGRRGHGERRDPRRPGPAVQRRLHGHGGAAGQLRPGAQDPRRAAHPGPARAGPLAAVGHRLDRRAWCRRSAGSPRRAATSPSRSACTPPTTSCATPSCRSTPAGRSARSSRPPTPTPARTGRRYSVEYALIRDVNDQPYRADLLGKLLAGRLAHVNLIPLNPTPGSPWDASPLPAQREFVARLRAAGVATTVRDTRGQDIDGACGQLAAADRVEGVPERGRARCPRGASRRSSWARKGTTMSEATADGRGARAQRTPTSPAAGCGRPSSARWTGWSATPRWSPASAAAGAAPRAIVLAGSPA